MTLLDLIRLTADSTGNSISETKRTIMEFCDQLAAAIRSGENVEIKGLFTCKTVTRAAYTGRNFDGQPVNIPERKVVTVKPSKLLLKKK